MVNVSSLSVRSAMAADLSFVCRAILEAEAGGKGPIPWCALFGFAESEFEAILREILEEGIEGQEWCLEHFRIATLEHQPVAALSAWIEGEEGSGSAMLKSALMYHFISEERRSAAQARLEIFSRLRLPRKPGALQLECIFTAPEWRGKGVMPVFLEKILKEIKSQPHPVRDAEIQLSGDNAPALAAYRKAGFELTEEVQYPGPESEIHAVFPGKSRIQLLKQISL